MRSPANSCSLRATRKTSRWAVCLPVIVCLAIPVALAACGGAASTSTTATASSSRVSQYTTKNFRFPLTVATDGVRAQPTEDSSNFLSWDAVRPGGIRVGDGSQYNKIRFLVPAKVYRPNTEISMKPPKHYVQFLLGQRHQGVKFSAITKLTVDGRPATLMTATTRVGLDGTIGCPDVAADQGEGCFGMQPDLALRIAVLDIGGVPVVAWARTSAKAPDQRLVADFEAMLNSVRFR
jgi:hypothetical protein